MKQQTIYKMSMTEDELIEAIEYFSLHKHGVEINIINLTHKTKNWTGGHGLSEIDYSEPDGVMFTAT